MSARLLSWAVLGFLAVCTPVPAMAQENIYWISAGGSFQDAANWSKLLDSDVTPAEPDSSYRAVFVFSGIHTVTLNGSANTTELLILSGDVAFNLNGNSLNTGPILSIRPLFIPEGDSRHESATFSNGTLSATGILVGAPPLTHSSVASSNQATLTLSSVQGFSNNLEVAQIGTGILNLTDLSRLRTGPLNSSVNVNIVNIGANGGANGSVNITGGSTWEITGGTLNIGSNFGRGTVTVDSYTGDTSLTAGVINVGAPNGNGTMNIINHGHVTSVDGSIGAYSGSTGSVNITDGSSWQITGGSLTYDRGFGITDTLTFPPGVLNIGNNSGQGTVTVSGGGSYLTAGGVNVGAQSGIGTMNILNDGLVISNSGSLRSLVGATQSGIGTVSVDGPGARWFASDINIGGNGGHGAVTIGHGGLVEARDILVQDNGELNVIRDDVRLRPYEPHLVNETTLRAQSINVSNGGHATFTGNVSAESVTVDGFGSGIVQNGLTNVLITNSAGLGSLNIVNGGQYFGAPDIGRGSVASPTGLAYVNVQGNGSQWVIGTSYVLGLGGGFAQATVQQGGFASSADLTVGGLSAGALLVDGDGSRWSSSGSVQVAPPVPMVDHPSLLVAGAAGTISLSNGGSMDVSGNLTVWGPGHINISGGHLTAGAIDISGGTLINHGGSILSSGPLSVSGGGLYSTNGDVIAGSGGFSSITITGALSMLRTGGEGVVRIGNGASLNLLNGGRVDGAIKLRGGEVNRPAGLTLNAQRSVEGYGLINANVQVAGNGSLVAHNGTLTVNGSITSLAGSLIGLDHGTLTANSFTVFGALVGTGTIATTDGVAMHGYLNAGFPDFLVDPDHSGIGTMTFLSNITFGSDSITEFDIGGLNWGDYDHIIVKGTAMFGGTLILNFINGFTLDGPASLSLFTDDFLGSFDSVIVHGLGPDFKFSLAGDNTGLSLLIDRNDVSSAPVPEPATAWLCLIGGATLLAYRRWQSVRLTSSVIRQPH